MKLPTRPALAPAADIKLTVTPPGRKTRVGHPLYTRGFNVWNFTGNPLTLASVTGDGGGSANPTIVFLDPPGTVRIIPPSQGQSQKDLLSQLCAQSIDAVTCKFKITG